MPSQRPFYGESLALATDLYQLTMAQGYWRSGIDRREAVFHLTFRQCPFGGGFALAAGLATAVEWIEQFAFSEDDLAYLAGIPGNNDQPLLAPGFLEMLAELRLTVDVDAIPEGTPVFAHEPLVRVRGPLLEAQLMETALLNLINFQTLIATKAARIVGEAGGDSVLEFGLRRAQGIDGGLSAARAAYLGGCAATSNVLAGKRFGIPVKGTHAHSWVMAFDSEPEAFAAYAAAMPNNCVFLVDTYDSIAGVRHAIAVGEELRRGGHELVGIRLDSGDLTALSREARRMLDEAGFPSAAIVASNDLDEHLIRELKQQGAAISVWGVGTRLATAYDQPALGGVFKLSALRSPQGEWEYKLKLSEQPVKISNPGIQQVRRYFDTAGRMVGDCIYDEPLGIGESPAVRGFAGEHLYGFPEPAAHEDLLRPIFRGGRLVYDVPSLEVSRRAAAEQLERLAPAIRRLKNPEPYRVGLEENLYELKHRLISEARSRPA